MERPVTSGLDYKHMSWPFKPRQTKRLQPEEVKDIRMLLKHVKDGNMEIIDIARGFQVDEATVRKIRDKKTHARQRRSNQRKRA